MKQNDNVYDFRCFFLCPNDRWALFEKIDERCEQMLIGCSNDEYHRKYVNNHQQQHHIKNNEETSTSSIFKEEDLLNNNDFEAIGILEETSKLLTDGSFSQWSMAAKAIGYRQAVKYLLRPSIPSQQKPSSSSSARTNNDTIMKDSYDYEKYEEFLSEFRTATRNYASEQIKWFRKDKKILFLNIDFKVRNPPQVPLTKQQNQELIMKRQGESIKMKRKRELDLKEKEQEKLQLYYDFENKSKERQSKYLLEMIDIFNLTEKEYHMELESELQLKIRENVLKQGKKMRIYSSQKWLIKQDIELLSNRKQKQLKFDLLHQEQRERRKLLKSKSSTSNENNQNSADDSDINIVNDVTLKQMLVRADACTMRVREAGIVFVPNDPQLSGQTFSNNR